MNRIGKLVLCLGLALSAGCSLKQAGINRMAAAVANSSRVYEADNDPEFVRLAAPSTLKTIEMLLSQSPKHEQLLLTACSGFTEYAYAFLHVEAEVRGGDTAAAKELRTRALHMYERARGYCERGLEARHPGMLGALRAAPASALRTATRDDVPLFYWLAASWAAELSIAPDQLARVGDLPQIRSLLERARGLDEGWQQGAIYEALIAVDALPPLLGGSASAARADFDNALRLSKGASAFAYVAYASAVKDDGEREQLLRKAVEIDPDAMPAKRLTNLVAQRYARALLNAAGPRSPAGR